MLERLLLYERINVPTVDFTIIAPLVHWFGVEVPLNLLESEAPKFGRLSGGLGYVGSRNGLAVFRIRSGETQQDD